MLGSLEVRSEGRLLDLGWPKQRALLAALLLSAGHPVSRAELVDAVWGERPPASATTGLQKHVSGLRAVLGADRIRTRPHGYQLVLAPGELDLDRFDALATDGRWEDALALWRGPPLEDVMLGPSCRARADALLERRRTAQAATVDARLARGEHEAVAAELRELTAADPLDERRWAQLMNALHACGRTAEALAAFATARAALADQLGADPGAGLARAHRELLAVEPERAWVAVCQLPPRIADFVGRADAVAETLACFDDAADAPLVAAVCGPPGVGKTTLAVRVAHRLRERYPDGQLYLHLGGASASPRDGRTAAADLLRALGVDGKAIPAELDGRSAMLRARLADRRVLLVLDDAHGPAQITPLFPGTAGCGVLVTSRSMLGTLPGARHVRLAPLTDGEAIELLGRLAGADRVGAEPAPAQRVVATCGRLPLAVRIAGARLAGRPFASIADLADRLGDERRRLDELSVGDIGVRPNLELSYRALPARARAVFRGLGLLGPRHFGTWTAAALDGGPDAELVLEQLLAANLLTVVGTAPHGPASGCTTCWRSTPASWRAATRTARARPRTGSRPPRWRCASRRTARCRSREASCRPTRWPRMSRMSRTS